MIGAWLRRVERSAFADRLIVRGSLVTRRYFPSRKAVDVDHLSLDAKDFDDLRTILDGVLTVAGPEPLVLDSQMKIWADTPLPGLRSFFSGGLQVDIGFGDPLTLPPERVEIEGANVLAARIESMIAWKIHGLVELGPRGRWRAKDLHDVALYASLKVDDAELAKAIATAFKSRGHATSLLDELRTRAEWGASASSKKRWKSFAKKNPGVPELATVIETVRKRFEPIFRACEGTR